MAEYATRILDRVIAIDDLLELSNLDLQVLEEALSGTGIEQAS